MSNRLPLASKEIWSSGKSVRRRSTTFHWAGLMMVDAGVFFAETCSDILLQLSRNWRLSTISNTVSDLCYMKCNRLLFNWSPKRIFEGTWSLGTCFFIEQSHLLMVDLAGMLILSSIALVTYRCAPLIRKVSCTAKVLLQSYWSMAQSWLKRNVAVVS